MLRVLRVVNQHRMSYLLFKNRCYVCVTCVLRVCYVCVTCVLRVQLILIRSFFSSKIHTLKYNIYIYIHTQTQEKPYQISAAAATIMDSAKILKFQLFFPKGMPIATATTLLSLKITQATKSYLHFNFSIFRQPFT